MAKKKQTKKHKFKYAAPSSATPVAGGFDTTTVASPMASKAKASAVSAVVAGPGYAYVSRDLRRVGVLAVSLIATEVILWLLFGHTGLGNAVYNLVSIN